jgi:hypothetical protein
MGCKPLQIAVLSLLFIAPGGARGSDPLATRKERLAKMPAVEKDTLRQNKERFDQLSAAEQARLRRLDTKLTADPQGKQLRKVMLRYNEWLRAIPSGQRIELLSRPAEERVQRIRLLMEEQERLRFQEMLALKLQPGDQKVLLDWVSGIIERDEARIMEQLPPADRQRLARIEDEDRRRVMLFMTYRRHSGQNVRLLEFLKPTEDDIAQLAGGLSALARDTLDEARDPAERNQVVQNWVRAALESRRPQVSKEQLERYFRQKVTAEQREYLQSLPRDRMRIELQRMYMQDRFKSNRMGAPFGGPRRQQQRREQE